jgi:hypothetical protein
MDDVLSKELDRLRTLVGRMERRIAELERGPAALADASPAAPPQVDDTERSRRGVFRLAGIGLAGAAVAAVARPTAAQAACGGPINGSCINTTADKTTIEGGWPADQPRAVLEVMSPTFSSVAAFGDPSRAVLGSNDGMYGVHGLREQTASTPNGTAGVYGEHKNTDIFGTGVIGSHAGAGWGMWARTVSGIGIHADGGTGIGVEGVATGPASSSYGVRGEHAGTGCVAVKGDAVNGVGVLGRGKVQGVQGLATGTTFSTSAVFGYLSNSASEGAGVYGLTASTGGTGYGVVGRHSGTGVGALGLCDGGTGVEGRTQALNANTYGVVGRVSSSAPAAGTAGVYGITTATNGAGYGVFGKHNGTGTAVYGQTPKGVGVRGFGGTGRGGVFTGASAQVNLTPGALATHPTNGTRGDLYVDNTGRLWFCKTGGTTATWAQVG